MLIAPIWEIYMRKRRFDGLRAEEIYPVTTNFVIKPQSATMTPSRQGENLRKMLIIKFIVMVFYTSLIVDFMESKLGRCFKLALL